MRDSANLRNVENFVDQHSDIYRRCNPREAIQIVAPLEALINRTKELAAEFNEHPTLLSIVQVAEKVLGLPLYSPVISICTGVELVLSRVNDWQLNAPKPRMTTQNLSQK